MDGQVILAVDDQGKFLGYIPKSVGHTGQGRRHLAITVLLYNSKGQVLLQKRKHKVFNNIWDFTGSTHPLHKDGGDETLEEAARRCLETEWDIRDIRDIRDLRVIGGFNYFAKIDSLCENEHDNLLIGEYNGEVRLNPDAAYEYKWVNKSELLKDMEANPDKYSAWANEGLKLLKNVGFF